MKAPSIFIAGLFLLPPLSQLEAKVKGKATDRAKNLRTQQLVNAFLSGTLFQTVTINNQDYIVYSNGMREPHDPNAYQKFMLKPNQGHWDKLSSEGKILVAMNSLCNYGDQAPEDETQRTNFGRRFLSQLTSENALLKIYQGAWGLATVQSLAENWRIDRHFEGAPRVMQDLFRKMKALKPEAASEALCEIANAAGQKVDPRIDSHDEAIGSYGENKFGNSYLVAERLMMMPDGGPSNSPNLKCIVNRNGEKKEMTLKDLMAEAKKIREPWLRQFEADRQNLKLGKGKPASARGSDPFSKLNCSPEQLQKALKPFWDPLKEHPNRAMISYLTVREPGCVFEGHFEQKINGSVTLHFRGYWAAERPQKPLPVKSWESLVENWKNFADSLAQKPETPPPQQLKKPEVRAAQ